MIRKLQKADLNDVANLWLDTNLKAHNLSLLNTGTRILNS